MCDQCLEPMILQLCNADAAGTSVLTFCGQASGEIVKSERVAVAHSTGFSAAGRPAGRLGRDDWAGPPRCGECLINRPGTVYQLALTLVGWLSPRDNLSSWKCLVQKPDRGKRLYDSLNAACTRNRKIRTKFRTKSGVFQEWH